MTINPVYVRGGQSARDDLLTSSYTIIIHNRQKCNNSNNNTNNSNNNNNNNNNKNITIESEVTGASSTSGGSWRLRHVAFL